MRRFAAVALLAAAAGCSSSSTPDSLTVASRNLYLGGDIFSVIRAGSALEAAIAVNEVWTSVKATNFAARAPLIAAELAALQPDVIGLQEVSIWRTGPGRVCAGDLSAINTPMAADVQYDYLALLLSALQAQGLTYVVAHATQSFDAELCSVDPTGATDPFDVRWTDRDVILVRSDLAFRNTDGGTYAAMVEFPIPGTDPPVLVPDRRAWNVAEVQKNGQWYRVFETHLEVQEIPTPEGIPPYIFQLAQAGELVGGQVVVRQAVEVLPTVVVGDFNTQAEQPVASPLRVTYNYLSGVIPFPDLGIEALLPVTNTFSPLADAWPATSGSAPGLTWGFDGDLRGGTMSQRIDFAFTWHATPLSTSTFGATDLTATTPPLHSSDHLGIVVTLQP
jgi:endonuclease/exonuclease/phosphatase family metal-dependent hydrolase